MGRREGVALEGRGLRDLIRGKGFGIVSPGRACLSRLFSFSFFLVCFRSLLSPFMHLNKSCSKALYIRLPPPRYII